MNPAPGPGEVLRYDSDGDVRSPFLGLKIAIRGLFFGGRGRGAGARKFAVAFLG